MKVQVTLTVPEAKVLIGKAIASLPEVQYALKNARVLIKGGTTTSALSEELVGIPLRVSGRITPRGTVSAMKEFKDEDHPHDILIQNGQYRNVDLDGFPETVRSLGKDDVAVIPANALDIHGNAAMMAGSPLGGPPGQALSGLMAQGVNIIIAVALDKLIPGSINEAVKAAGRKSVDLAMGMAVGLIPVMGKVVTEGEAVTILTGAKCTVIGSGSILGAEGAKTMVIDGSRDQVESAWRTITSLKGAETKGLEESLVECDFTSGNCKRHLACVYCKEGIKNLKGLHRNLSEILSESV